MEGKQEESNTGGRPTYCPGCSVPPPRVAAPPSPAHAAPFVPGSGDGALLTDFQARGGMDALNLPKGPGPSLLVSPPMDCTLVNSISIKPPE